MSTVHTLTFESTLYINLLRYDWDHFVQKYYSQYHPGPLPFFKIMHALRDDLDQLKERVISVTGITKFEVGFQKEDMFTHTDFASYHVWKAMSDEYYYRQFESDLNAFLQILNPRVDFTSQFLYRDASDLYQQLFQNSLLKKD